MAANNESNGGANGTNGTLSRNFSLSMISGTGTNRDYTTLNVDHGSPRRRCEHSHTVSDLEYYNPHRTMNQLEQSNMDSTTLRTRYAEMQSENQRLEQENQRLRQKFNEQELLYLSKLEQAQEETGRLVEQIEVLNQEKNSLKQQRSNMYKDFLKCREAHQKTLQIREEEDKQLKLLKAKAAKDVKRLMDERNATMAEYSLVMSERDQVHKEMERLTDDLAQAMKKIKQLEQEKKQLGDDNKTLRYQAEGLRREIASALQERDRALKECGELRDKFGEPGEGQNMAQSRLFDSLSALGEGGTRKEHQSDQRTGQRQRLDNLDQANQELESLRKNLDKAQSELSEAIQEAEVSKGRRDWAFSERDKIVQERESIRTLCDNMRKERDRAVSELAESLRESDGLKKQKTELQKELTLLREMLESQEQQNHSSWDEDILEVEMQLDGLDVGVELMGGREDPGGDGGVYVDSVAPLSPADGKLRQHDRILKVNDMDCASASRRIVLEAMRSGVPTTRMLIKRRKHWNGVPSPPPSTQTNRWVYTARLAPACHGLTLKNGIYIERISRGSLAAKDSTLAVGDRVLKINDKSVEELGGVHEAMRGLNNDSLDVVTVTTLKTAMAHNNPNVFTPVRRYKKENRSSQTDEGLYDIDHRRYPTGISDYKNNSSAWIKDKFDTVLRGRHRHFKDEKKKYRNSSPNPLENQGHEAAIAELDMVIDSYHGTSKRSNHRRHSTATKDENKNGGTWPKARAVALLNPETASGTVVARKRERPALSLLATKDEKYCCQVGAAVSAAANAAKRNSTPLPLSLLNDRHQVFKSLDGGGAISGDSFEKLRSPNVNQRLSVNMNSDNSLDFPGSKYNDIIHAAPPYYSRMKSSIAGSKYGSDSEREETTSTHTRVHSQLFGASRVPYPLHPHPHPHLDQSRESFLFDGPYSHASGDLHDNVGTFPRKQRDPPRFRVPSNPSVTGSVERGSSERGSPMPIFHVEVLPGELRKVHIEKSNEPLGIQINCLPGGGIFVSTVSDNSLASQVGLQIGDQLLEVCGINMRNATYNLAASVLRQCGNSITMLVQYSPDKYNELEGSGSCSGDSSCNEEEDENEATPCNSPKEIRKSTISHGGLVRNAHNPILLPTRQPALRNPNGLVEPRYLDMETMKTSNLGISLVGGNAYGIFIHSVQPDSVAYRAGLRTGDQILEYNGSDLRAATAEEAAYELAKPADKVRVLAHYRIDRYHEIKDKPGDSLYVRCGFDRAGDEHTEPPQLQFSRDDVLYVDNTMFNGVPGQWRAWRLDADGHRQHCGVVPSKYKVEEELLLRRSAADLDSRSPSNTSSARRSFFRRKKHHQSGIGQGSNGSSRDSKELASFSSLAPGWYSEDLSLCSYQRVERLGRPEFRPILVLGPLAYCFVDKLVSDFPDQFQRAPSETRRCSQAVLDRELADGLLVDYKRRGSFFECTTVVAVRNVCASKRHCMLDVAVSSVERLHRLNISTVVLLVKFKSTKQIRELKDTRFSLDKLSGKAAKEMFEHGQKLEVEYRHLITAVVTAGANVAHVCAQVKAAVDLEHSRSQWVPLQ
ncbi:hypothetical protein HHI36_013843 [Cryptolaemus montrouzieri]|uniref:Uncharacterized protein n=1 Tax=Cryptolaemus montrouzieri TaxID=559131 RepID=A0ABD2N119_9CUCU